MNLSRNRMARTGSLKQLFLATGIALFFQPVCQAADPPQFASEDQELLYYWGTALGQQLLDAGVKDKESVDWITRGLQDVAAGRSPGFGEEYRSLLSNYLVKRRKDAAEAETRAAQDYLASLSREANTVTTKSGLVIRTLSRGKGARPTKDSKVTVHYTGKLRDGSVFDSSVDRGTPFETRLSSVIPCWTEAIPMMRVGGRAIIGCPPELAYGANGNARIPGGSALTFEVELIGTSD